MTLYKSSLWYLVVVWTAYSLILRLKAHGSTWILRTRAHQPAEPASHRRKQLLNLTAGMDWWWGSNLDPTKRESPLTLQATKANYWELNVRVQMLQEKRAFTFLLAGFERVAMVRVQPILARPWVHIRNDARLEGCKASQIINRMCLVVDLWLLVIRCFELQLCLFLVASQTEHSTLPTSNGSKPVAWPIGIWE